MNWPDYYPVFLADDSMPKDTQVRFADVGCGFGGLTVSLGEKYPHKLVLAMELREPVVEMVRKRIDKLRSDENQGHNIAVERVNAMKHLPNYFQKGQLEKLFFLFPDPHFKKKVWRRRIIRYVLFCVSWFPLQTPCGLCMHSSPTLLAEYAFVLQVGGLLYTNTDVKDLHDWMVQHLDAHGLFTRIPQDEMVRLVVCKPGTSLLTPVLVAQGSSVSLDYECNRRRSKGGSQFWKQISCCLSSNSLELAEHAEFISFFIMYYFQWV